MDNTIEVTGIPTQLLKLLDERIRQTGSDRTEYIRNLIEKNIYGVSHTENQSKAFQGKKSPFDPEQWEADMQALAQRAEEIPVLPEEAFTRESIYGDRD